MAPQNLRKAEELMRELIHPAIASLARQIEHDEFPAVKYALDWGGFKAPEQTVTDGELIVTVEHVERKLELPDRAG